MLLIKGLGDSEPPLIGERICRNCDHPLFEHCEIHFVPCCPGKCPGRYDPNATRKRWRKHGRRWLRESGG